MGPDLSLDLWFGRCLPLNPYLRALLHYLRKELKPRDLRIVPDELVMHPNEFEVLNAR